MDFMSIGFGVLNGSGEAPELGGRPGLLRPCACAWPQDSARAPAAEAAPATSLPGPPPSRPASTTGRRPSTTSRQPCSNSNGLHASESTPLSPVHHVGSALPTAPPPPPRSPTRSSACGCPPRAAVGPLRPPPRLCPPPPSTGAAAATALRTASSVLRWAFPMLPLKRSCRRGSCHSHQPAPCRYQPRPLPQQ